MSRSYEGFSELFAMEESNQVNQVSAIGSLCQVD